MVTQQDHEKAVARSQELRDSGRYIVAAHYDRTAKTFHIAFKAGFTISFAKERCQVTAAADDNDLDMMEVSPAGASVDFPKIDDGLTAEGLLEGRFGNARWEREWAEKHREMQAA